MSEPATSSEVPALEELGLPIDYDSLPYWYGCRERQLKILHCGDCGEWIHPPRHMCPACWSTRVAAEPSSGRGVVETFVVERSAGERVLGVISLDDQPGVRLTATIVDADANAIIIGMPVELTWIEFRGHPVPAFRPVSERA